MRAPVMMVILAAALTSGSPVGVGYSGGGITAIAATLCGHHALLDLLSITELNATVSTASGGTLGYLIHQSTLTSKSNAQNGRVSHPIEFPPALSASLTLEQLSSSKAAAGYTWWANAVNYIPNVTSLVAAGDDRVGWWQDVMATLFRLGYGVLAADVGAARGVGNLVMNSAMLRKAACPIKRATSGATPGVMEGASDMRHVSVEAVPGAPLRARAIGNLQLAPASASNLSLLDGAAWSSAFYAAPIIESKGAFVAEEALEAVDKGLLVSATALDDAGAEETVYLIDGGMVDTTGIAALLQRGVRRIFAWYNNNDALAPAGSAAQSESASFAYLFGVPQPTDTMNSLAGPNLTQVFAAELYPAVLANLTDPGVLLARLTNVSVLPNAYLGIGEGLVLDELLILSNARADAFLSSFDDARVGASVSPEWPDRMPTGFGALEANLLCEFQRWKVRRHAPVLRRFFGQ